MRVIQRDFFGVSRSDVFRVIPIGDTHVGAKACDEKLLRAVVQRVADDPNCYWIGLGDFCDFINVRDPRFSAATLADWISVSDLVDLAKAQRDHFLEIIEPIAHKCLALVAGNHEESIKKHSERAIYDEIVAKIKGMGKIDEMLGVGYYGWLQLRFYRHKTKRRCASNVTFNLHHGFVGGKLAGAKALNMQRWLWTHDADIVLFGHSHNTSIQPESVERINRAGQLENVTRVGAYTGTFLRSTNSGGPSTYSERKGYFPLPVGGVEIELRPAQKNKHGRIRMIYDV